MSFFRCLAKDISRAVPLEISGVYDYIFNIRRIREKEVYENMSVLYSMGDFDVLLEMSS